MKQIDFIEKAMVLCSCLSKGHTMMSGSQKKNALWKPPWEYFNALSFVYNSEPAFTVMPESQENELPSQLFASVEVYVRE